MTHEAKYRTARKKLKRAQRRLRVELIRAASADEAGARARVVARESPARGQATFRPAPSPEPAPAPRTRPPRASPSRAAPSRRDRAAARFSVSSATTRARRSSSMRFTSASSACAVASLYSRCSGMQPGVVAEERRAAPAREGHRPERLAHAVLEDHRAHDVGGAVEVVVRAGRDLVEHDLLRGAAAEAARRRAPRSSLRVIR